MALVYYMAPVSVMEEHLFIKISHASATLLLGVYGMDQGSLNSAGV